jgi:hypothetical protein
MLSWVCRILEEFHVYQPRETPMKISVAFCLVSILTSCARFSAPQTAIADAHPKLANNALRSDANVPEKTAIDARFRSIAASEGGRAAATRVALGREQVEYLQTILPEDAAHRCSDVPVLAQSQLEAQTVAAQLEQELKSSDATYDEHKALSLYEASREKVAEGRGFEFECLLGELDKLGGNAETRSDLTETLKSLAVREQLVVEAGLEQALPCLDRGVEQFKTLIAQDYQQFSREPVLATQTQLHRDFRGEFEAQIACLQSSVEQRPTAAND